MHVSINGKIYVCLFHLIREYFVDTHPLFDPSVDLKTGYRTTTVLCMPVFEDQASTNPKIVAVAMCINKKEGNRVVSFSTIDNVNMSRYCREIQFALGRLSLDISYYKVVSDGGAPGPNEVQACKENQAKSCSDGLEAEIISSIVHKYCQPNDLLEGLEGIDQILATSSVSDTWAAQAVAEEALLMNKENNGTMIRFGDLDRWDFNSLDLSNPEIFMASSLIFRSYGLLELFHISSEKFLTFLSHVANHYRPNPFHNFQHAFQVMHVTHMLILKECGQYFNRVDMFTMLISSLCHGRYSVLYALIS
jgi:dual 3',5'-cyclic-AMP and -GMP phosphodiesterase 11